MNPPYPELTRTVIKMAINAKIFTNLENEVWVTYWHVGFNPSKRELLCTCKDWQEAFKVAELLNKFRRVAESAHASDVLTIVGS